MKIADMKVTELINEVGSGTPAPGGGAVAGLAGGVGVALTMMVNGLTLDKKGFENDRERLLDAIAKGNELKERFIDVMNRDSEVFDVLIESLALPKDDDAHKAIRRDPLSGRSYVYQAMRVTGSGDPTVPFDQTRAGKLPQLHAGTADDDGDLRRGHRPLCRACRHDEPERRQRSWHRRAHAQDRHAERMAERAHQPFLPEGQGLCR